MTSAPDEAPHAAAQEDEPCPPDVAERVQEIAEQLENEVSEVRFMQDMTRMVMSDQNDFRSTIRYCLRRICETRGWALGHAVVVNSDLPQIPMVGHVWHLTQPTVQRAFKRTTEALHQEQDGPLWTPPLFDRSKVVILHDLANEPGFVRSEAAQDVNLRSAVFVPVELDDTIPAYLEFFSHGPIDHKPATIELLTCVAALISQVLQRVLLEKAVSNSMWLLQNRVGRELHDSVCQDLVGLAFQSRKLAEVVKDQNGVPAQLARELSQGLDTVLERARAISQGLCPVDCEADEFSQAMRDLVSSAHKRFGILIDLDFDTNLVLANDEQSRDLYFIAHEGLSNAAKHSKASRIQVAFARRDTHAILRIEDNGVGLSNSQYASSGIGLRVMHFRASQIGAQLDLSEAQGGGTILTCSFPLQETSNDNDM